MLRISCPRCGSEVEIGEFAEDGKNRIAVFCSKKDCLYHKNPLIGIDKKNSDVYISEALM